MRERLNTSERREAIDVGEGLAVGVLHWRLIQSQRLRFELPKVADKVRLDTPLNHSAVAFGFLAVDAGAATALCGTNGWSIGDTYFRVLARSVCSFSHSCSPCRAHTSERLRKYFGGRTFRSGLAFRFRGFTAGSKRPGHHDK